MTVHQASPSGDNDANRGAAFLPNVTPPTWRYSWNAQGVPELGLWVITRGGSFHDNAGSAVPDAPAVNVTLT